MTDAAYMLSDAKDMAKDMPTRCEGRGVPDAEDAGYPMRRTYVEDLRSSTYVLLKRPVACAPGSDSSWKAENSGRNTGAPAPGKSGSECRRYAALGAARRRRAASLHQPAGHPA